MKTTRDKPLVGIPPVDNTTKAKRMQEIEHEANIIRRNESNSEYPKKYRPFPKTIFD